MKIASCLQATSLTALLFTSLNLCAQDPIHFGAHASLLNFQGDFRAHQDGSQGNEIGLHLGIPIHAGHEIRPSLSWRTPPKEIANTGGHLYGGVLGVDYLFYPAAHQDSFYCFAGVNAFTWMKSGEAALTSPSGASYSRYKDTTGIEPSIGLGFRFNKWFSLESRVAFSHIDRSFGQRDSGSILYLGLVLH